MIIGIQGIEGSFSEEAAKSYCKKFNIENFSIEYLVSSMNVLDHLSKKSIDMRIKLWSHISSQIEHEYSTN